MRASEPTRGKSTALAAAEADSSYSADYFDRQLHRYHWFHNNAAKRELRWREILRMLEPGANDRVLELGCATGEQTLRFAPLVGEIVGVDSSAMAIERARERAASVGARNATFLQLDAADLGSLGDTSFDKIAAIDFVEHIDDASLMTILGEARRVLRARGRLVIFTPSRSHYVERLKARNILLRQTQGHIAVRGELEYRTMLPRSGFTVTSLYFSPSTYPIVGQLDRWMSRAPSIGSLFRFRICIVAEPIATSE